MEGWIKLHRKILDNPIITKDSDYLAVWIYLLLNTTHKEYDVLFQGKRTTLKKGQLLTGRKSIAEKLNIDENKVQRILKTLENEQQIEQQSSNKNRLITIVSWDKYQEDEQQIEQQVNNKRTTTEQQVNTNKNVKNIKNDNNNKKENIKEKKIHFAEFVSMTNAENEKLISTYGKEFTDQCIKVLDNYKGASGKTYRSDYRAILNWVIEKVKNTPVKKNKNSFNQREYENLDFLYKNIGG